MSARAPLAPASVPVAPPRRELLERAAPLLLGAAGVVLLPALALLVDRDALVGTGPAGVRPVWAWVGIAAVVLGCVVELLAPDPRARVLTGLTGILALCTTGLPAVVEPGARLAASWVHRELVDAVARTGRVPAGADPGVAGFAVQWAWIGDAAGGVPLDLVLRWSPPVITLLWAAGVYALARHLLDGMGGPWVATWLFLGLNATDLDSFSPQATAMVPAVAVLVLAVGLLATRRRPLTFPSDTPLDRLQELARRHSWWPPRRWRAPRPPVSPNQVRLAWTVVVLAAIAIAATDPLAPWALLVQLALLTVAGRLWGGRGLVLALVLCVVIALVLGEWFPTGPFDVVVGSPGRVLLVVVALVLGLLRAWARWRRTGDVVWIVLALVPTVLAWRPVTATSRHGSCSTACRCWPCWGSTPCGCRRDASPGRAGCCTRWPWWPPSPASS